MTHLDEGWQGSVLATNRILLDWGLVMAQGTDGWGRGFGFPHWQRAKRLQGCDL